VSKKLRSRAQLAHQSSLTMLEASRSWFRRNRTRFAVTFGVLGASYLVAQYVLGKISEARERMTSERIAKEKYDILQLCPRLLEGSC